ncbi:MAG: ketoacyl-ACP synthase III [Bacteroidota bacterium]|nr:ketoacyl-ACP synthase III [Bacteroidota bacterium]
MNYKWIGGQMQVYRIKGVHIEGIVACVPENKVDNEAVLREMYGDEARLIIESTGIKTRYLASKGTSSSDLCIACAKDLLIGTKTEPADIGAVIFVTFTPDRLMPFNAAIVQDKLGLSKEIPSFDISLACSGYSYGLYVAATFAKASGKKVLLLDGDIQSAYMSKYDKSTVPVMADAGSATLLSLDQSEIEWKFSFYTDGSGRDSLMIPTAGSASPLEVGDLEYREYKDGGKRRLTDIYMDGFAIFRFVASDVSKWLLGFLSEAGESSETIDSFVPHQANMYMIKKLAKKLNFDWYNATWQSGDSVGNSASATVPVTIAFDYRNKLKNKIDNKVLISGFGGGLSASAGIITLSSKAYYNFFQYKGNNNEE